MATDAWGVDDGYFDVAGNWHATAPEVTLALHGAMGADDHPGGPPGGPPLWFVRQGDAPDLLGPAALVLEDGTGLRAEHHLPGDLPLGYHDLHPLDGGPVTRLIVTPGRCHLPEGLRTWGWISQVYALRSARNWGHGDLGDVASVAAMARRQGAGFTALSPLHAPGPLLPQQPSPYYASSRRWRSPLLIRVEDVPGARALGGGAAGEMAALAAAGRAASATPVVDRDRAWTLKGAALDLLWERRRGRTDPAFERWRADQGESLQSFAVHQALAEHHRSAWPDWPTGHRRPDSPAVAEFARAHADRVAFHAWLQWLVDVQLAGAARAGDLLVDLAVGVDPAGADAWRWQGVYAQGARVGAPPDQFNPAGQAWGLPPYVPWALRAARYEPFVEVVRATVTHACAIRIDHVMGLFRLYWIVDGAGPGTGAYVRYAAPELLDILALESVRAGAVVVGEDLGTVEGGVREELAARRVLSTRLVWFEPEPPAELPEQCMAAVTTHDLPTVAGLLDGTDAADRHAAGVAVDEGDDAELRARLMAAAGMGDADGHRVEDAVAVAVAAHRAMVEGPPMLVAATLEDALGVRHRPNLPGTTTENPNWCRRLPVPVASLEAQPGVAAVAEASAPRRRPEPG